MHNKQLLASLDIGTTSIKMVVAQVNDEDIHLLGVGNKAYPLGKRREDLSSQELAQSIGQVVRKVEGQAQVDIDEVLVNLPAHTNRVHTEKFSIQQSSRDEEISVKTIRHLLGGARKGTTKNNRVVSRIVPVNFEIDGFKDIKDPLGMRGQNISLEAMVFTSSQDLVYNMKEAVEAAGLRVLDLVLEPLADASYAVSEQARDEGLVLINIGGGQTVASALHEDLLKYTHVVDLGGSHLTSDLSIVLDINPTLAESLKVREGYARPEAVHNNEEILIHPAENRSVETALLAEIIEARLEQIFTFIKEDLDRIGAFELPGGVVLVGGTSSLAGIQDLAEEIFERPVQVFQPQVVGARHSIYTTALGLIHYYSRLSEVDRLLAGVSEGEQPRKNEGQAQQKEEVKTQYIDRDDETIGNRIKSILASFFGEE